jgi:prevent-host-death family protein
MPEISATEAARRFADVLDRVEHDKERYTIVRRGKAVAHLEPISGGRGVDMKNVMRRHRPDSFWREELDQLRELTEIDNRP